MGKSPACADQRHLQVSGDCAPHSIEAESPHSAFAGSVSRASDLERFRAVLDRATEAIFIVRLPDAMITDVTSSACEQLGYTREELRSMPFIELIGEPLAESVRDYLTNRGAGNAQGNLICTLLRKRGGACIAVEMTISPVTSRGTDYAAIVARDSTARQRVEEALRKSEARYRAIVEDQTELVSRSLADSTLTFVNDAYCRYFGETRDELLGRNFWHHVPFEDRIELSEHFAKLSPEDPVGMIEHRVLMPDGETRWQQWTDRAIYDREGQFVEYQSVGRDITEHKRMDEALRESEQKLRFLSSQLLSAQEKERQRISRELHDELGQALTVLKLQIGAVAGQLRPGQEAVKDDCAQMLHYLDEVIENVRRLSRDLSPSILENLGLSSALRWLIEEFSRHHHISCTLEMTELSKLFALDSQRVIYRIFQEALTNIAKHAEATAVTVLATREQGGVRFMIKDNGRGFAMDQMQARDATEQGLGLAAMDERVRILGGVLTIDSGKGTGTTISFTAPVVDQGGF